MCIETTPTRPTSRDEARAGISRQNQIDPQIDHEELSSQSTPSRHTAPKKYSSGYYFRFVGKAFETIMNAAVTIFGLGVGVGLILGDSLRARPMSTTLEDTSAEGGAASMPSSNQHDAPPSCGAPPRTNIHHHTPISGSAELLPAQ
jgi:hypothetical protein